MSSSILCCGEALIDMLPAKTDRGRNAYVPVCGGSVFNTAVALGRLGARTRFLGGLSTDLFGETLRMALRQSGVDDSLSVTSHRPTTLAFVQLIDGQARYAFFDENSAGRMLKSEDMPALPEDVSTIFFGGISLATEPCATAYETLMARGAATNVTILDPNIRPGFIPDEQVYRSRLEHMVKLADIIKVSDEDLHWWFGAGDPFSHAQKLLQKGPLLLFLTRGASGATAMTKTLTISSPAPVVTVVDTVGAGDSFNAGVMHALDHEGILNKPDLASIDAKILENVLSLGIRAAAITVSRPGADSPWAKDLT